MAESQPRVILSGGLDDAVQHEQSQGLGGRVSGIFERDHHLAIISKGMIPSHAEAPDFGGDTAAKNAYYMGLLIHPVMEIYMILQEIKSLYDTTVRRWF